jgi:predicted NAD/FAD-dependent oxidoreductase
MFLFLAPHAVFDSLNICVAPLLLAEFATATGTRLPTPVHLQAHRWRHAFVEQALGRPCLVDQEIAAGACGDWCIAPRVEAAFESGRALAHSLLPMVGLAAPAAVR